MARQGWNRATFKKGDPITVVGHPMKDGSKGVSLFYVQMPDGKRLYHDIARPAADGSAPPPPANGVQQ
jgi:predicted acyl esterase